MKIAFIDNFAFNFGIAHLTPELKAAGHEVRLFNYPFSKWQKVPFSHPEKYYDFDRIASEVLAFAPDVLGGSVFSANYQFFRQLVALIKLRRPDLPVIAGGVLPTMATALFFEDTASDFVYRGEAEGNVCRLFDAVAAGTPGDVPNLCYRTADGFHQAEITHKVGDLDAIPYYDQNLYDTSRVLPMMTGRGCTMRCSYCSAGPLTRMVTPQGMKLIRKRSVDNVLDEIESVLRARAEPVATIYFNDDYFINGREWTAEFAEKYPQRIGIPFSCIAFPASVNDDIAALLRQAGCETVYMGFQTGAEDYKKKVLDRHEANVRVAEAISVLKKHGVECVVDHILNLPGETRDDIRTSLKFYVGYDVKWLNIAFLNYFPDSKITRYAYEKGFMSAEIFHNVLRNRRIGEQSYLGTIVDPQLSKQQIRWALCFRIARWLPASWSLTLFDKGFDRFLPVSRWFYYGFSLLTMAKELGLRAILVTFVVGGLLRRGKGGNALLRWVRLLGSKAQGAS